MAIVSFQCPDTQRLFTSGKTRRFANIQAVAERKLVQLDAAATLDFLRSPPGNRLEALTGDRQGSTAFASMPSGVYVLSGWTRGLPRWRSSITTDVTDRPQGEK